MKKVQIYISAAVFVLLTVIKLAFPALFSELGGIMADAFEMEGRHTAAAVEFGENAVRFLMDKGYTTGQKSIKTLAPENRNAGIFGKNARERIDAASETGAENKKINERIEAFISSQSDITGDAIPSNVNIEIGELGLDYISPVDGVKSSGFGYRDHPITGEMKFHFGTDFAAYTGTPVKAFADGIVIASGDSESYGKYVIIDHGGGYTTLYAHCSELCISSGDVKKGDTIALVGATGLATGPHLHFEIRYNGSYLNPEFYL